MNAYYKELDSFMQRTNTPWARNRLLMSVAELLKDRCADVDEIRDMYFHYMCVYFSLDRTNPNRAEAKIEFDLVSRLEELFVKRVELPNLTQHEKDEIIMRNKIDAVRFSQYLKEFSYNLDPAEWI